MPTLKTELFSAVKRNDPDKVAQIIARPTLKNEALSDGAQH